jgi:two-component system, chemotaxis family, protein-glutamate methylesterase/glutaminase
MENFPIIVIGASSGGLDALRGLLAGLSPQLPAAVLAVIHIGAFEAQLPDFFRGRSGLPVHYGRDGEPIMPGNLYLAPPDRHLVVTPGQMHLSHGPRENFSRPAVDPLFRSAAQAYGPLAIGVILTGNLSDGTAGLWELKQRGGIAIVQDPEEAESPSMPRSALQHVEVDYRLPLEDIAGLIERLAVEVAAKSPQPLSSREGSDMSYSTEEPVGLTCPDCGGAVRKTKTGSYLQFRCHIGHVFGDKEMALGQFGALEKLLESSLRLLKERIKLCQELAGAERTAKQEQAARAWEAARQQSEARLSALTGLLEQEWVRPELETV